MIQSVAGLRVSGDGPIILRRHRGEKQSQSGCPATLSAGISPIEPLAAYAGCFGQMCRYQLGVCR